MPEEIVQCVGNKPMKFRRPNGGVIAFSEAALIVMHKHCQLETTAAESGGILLGRFINETDDVVIDEAMTPTWSDQRSRFFFRRARRPAQMRVNATWAESAHTRNYLGEWHTHPEDDPVPSEQDLRNWRHIGQAAQYEQTYLIFVIVGRKRTRGWEWDKVSKSLWQLDYMQADEQTLI